MARPPHPNRLSSHTVGKRGMKCVDCSGREAHIIIAVNIMWKFLLKVCTKKYIPAVRHVQGGREYVETCEFYLHLTMYDCMRCAQTQHM